MEVSSGTGTSSALASNIQVDTMKKSMDVQEQQVLKVLDSANEQSKQAVAQKTGLGSNLNITG